MAKKRRKKSKSKSRRKTSKKRATRKTSTRRKTSKKRKAKRSGKMPTAVIVKHARSLKKNKRAAAIYRDVLGC